MSEQKKKQIEVYATEFSMYSIEGNLAEAVEFLKGISERCGPTAKVKYGRFDRWDDSYSFQVSTTRLETDAEFENRVAVETKLEAERLQRLQQNAESLGFSLVKK